MDGLSSDSVMLLMPKQNNRFNNIHYNFKYIIKGLKEAGYQAGIVELSNDGSSNTPDGYGINTEKVKYSELGELLKQETRFVGIDEYKFTTELERVDGRNVYMWVHYFNGASLYFKQYVDWPYLPEARKRIKKLYRGFFPTYLQERFMREYISCLRNHNTIAQSLWTSLLLTRIHNIQCQGIVYNPILEEEFPESNKEKSRDKIVLYLSGIYDTRLEETTNILNSIGNDLENFEFHSFGDEAMSRNLEGRINRKIKFHRGISREDLFRLYSEAVFTIAPQYNGNFEMVPVENLISYTPVATYLQPFQEITGKSSLVANLNNYQESVSYIRRWIAGGLTEQLEEIRKRLLSSLNYRSVTASLVQYLFEKY